MAIIFITGPENSFGGLVDVPGFNLDHHDVAELPGGLVRISAEVAESIVPSIEALGLTVDIEKTDAEVAAIMTSFDNSPPIS